MPDPVPLELAEKRRILYAKGLDGQRSAVAAALVAQGRLAESMEYLERTREPEALAQVRRAAVRAGDLFSLVRACQILRTEPEGPELRDLAGYAERAGRWYDAVNALDRAGDAERAEALRVEHCPDYRPFKPAGK